jgi:cell division protein FtsB
MIANALSRSRRHLTGRSIALLVLVGALLVAFVYPLRTYLGQRAQISELQRREQVLGKRNAELDRRIASLHDPRYLELLARECLGMVKRGEISFVVVPRQKVPLPKDC